MMIRLRCLRREGEAYNFLFCLVVWVCGCEVIANFFIFFLFNSPISFCGLCSWCFLFFLYVLCLCCFFIHKARYHLHGLFYYYFFLLVWFNLLVVRAHGD